MKSRRRKRYKLLLDEGLHLPQYYPKLNNLHDVVHIARTKYRGQTDKVIFKLAEKENRLLIVFNTKDFKPLITKESASVIILSTNLSDKQADLKICKILKEISPSQTKGYLISISQSGADIKIPDKS